MPATKTECPSCGRTSAFHDEEVLTEGHEETTATVEEDPHDYDRDELEIVIDAETGYVLREPIRHTCTRCGGSWVEERETTVDEVREWVVDV